ncbi:hypothetical protein RHSIM_Rhsim02G0151400 [Rhododendron simsii]|uniref:Replication factor A C-terminal domain-containing protein n=1 Tax=Rhododendron simsii TaxID=118357 RepID=A0A834LXX6_RHOSS|nr:hypothetical protein RHSIM_Rhsim02G0151400 [Rhododendron simsii]
MVEDYIFVQKISKDVARQILIQELESLGKNLNHFQLSQLVTSDSMKKATPREVEDEMNIPISENDLKNPDLLNDEQLIANNEILNAMAPSILPLSNVNLTPSNYVVQVMVIEKNVPKMSTSSNSQYQRMILQDKEVTHLKNQTIRYNFTPITAISQVRTFDPKLDVLFAVLEVGPLKLINDSYVVDVQVIDQRCMVNASKIRELPTTPSQLLLTRPTEESDDEITKIANLPVLVPKVEFLTVKGMARIIDFGQKFYYLACSLCNKATNAYGDNNFWCNYCLQKVPALAE